MAYQTGKAANERDLLDKLNRFLTADSRLQAQGQTWELLFNRTLPATATTTEKRQMVWKSTGTGTEQEMFVAAETASSIPGDIYNLNFYGGSYFNPDAVTADSITAGIVHCSPPVGITADRRDFEYHIVADGRHFKLVTFVGEVCGTAYVGFVLPPVMPTEYPYPLLVAGTVSGARLARYSANDNTVSSIADPRNNNCFLFLPNQNWNGFSGADYADGGGTTTQLVLPMAMSRSRLSARGVMQYLGPMADGSYPLYQVELVSVDNSPLGQSRWGAMDGVYWTAGIQLRPADRIRFKGNRIGLVVHNGQRRSTESYFVIDITAS